MKHLQILSLLVLCASWPAMGADINKQIVAELDPMAPTSAAYEENTNKVTTSKWGASFDYNVGGVISTGPELWTGTFTAHGPRDETSSFRREDMWPGERHKLDAVRLRWTVAKWEMPTSMRGWFVRGGYAYTRINSRANRFTEDMDASTGLPITVQRSDPADETDLVTDIRHGAMIGFGNRWLLMEQKFALTLGASLSGNFKRAVSVDSKDPNAKRDYETLIRDLPDTRMSLRPVPEINLGLGYAL